MPLALALLALKLGSADGAPRLNANQLSIESIPAMAELLVESWTTDQLVCPKTVHCRALEFAPDSPSAGAGKGAFVSGGDWSP